LGKLIEFRAVNKVSHGDRLDKRGDVIEFPSGPKAARAMWERMPFEMAQVLGAALDAERISDGSCWTLVRIKDSWSYVFLVGESEALFSVMTVEEFQAMRPELEQWAPEVFAWLLAING